MTAPSQPRRAGGPDWAEQFAAELVRLGLQPTRVSDLCAETVGQAGEAGRTPEAVFGPAHLYACHPMRELHRARPAPEPHLATTGGGIALALGHWELVATDQDVRRLRAVVPMMVCTALVSFVRLVGESAQRQALVDAPPRMPIWPGPTVIC